MSPREVRIPRGAPAALLAGLLLLAPQGCDLEKEPKPPPQQPVAGSGAGGAGRAAGVDAAVLAKLEKADALDGTTDGVVHRCVTCALGMDGAEAHSASYAGYTFHLCSARCLERFEAAPAEAVRKAPLP